MTTLTSSLIVRLVDRVSRPARGVANSLLGIQRAGAGANQITFGDRLTSGIRRNDAALARARGGLIDATAGFYALRTAIAAPVQSATSFEGVMADVKKVVNDFGDDTAGGPAAFAAFKDGLKELSTQVPLSVRELGEIAAAAGEAGFAGDQLLQMTETAAKISVAFGSSAAETGKMLAVMQKSYGMSFDEAVLLSDAMNHLSNNMASNAPDLMNFWTRIAADAKQAGFSQEQAVAMGSAMIASGHGADVAATSFRNMAKALGRGESATKRQRAAYGRLGFDAKTISEEMQVDAVGTTRKVLEAISQLPAAMRKSVSSDLFGDEARALGSIATNLEFFDKAMGSIADETEYAGSAFKEFETRAATFGNAAQIFKNRMETLKIAIGAALIPAINSLIERITPVIAKITDFANAHPELISQVMAAVGSIVAFKVAVAGLKFVGLLGRGGALSMLALGLNTVGKASARLWAAAAANVAYTGSLKAMSGAGALTGMQRLGAAVRGMAFAVPGVAALSGVFGWLASAAAAVGAAIAGITAPVWGAIAVGVAAVAAAGYELWKYWDRIKSVFSGVARRLGEGLQPAFDAIKPVLEAISPVTDAVGVAFTRMKTVVGNVIDWFKTKWGEFKEWIGGFFSKEVLTDEEKAAFEQSGYDMADAMVNSIKSVIGDLIEWFRNIPKRIIEAVGSINLGEIIKWPEPPQWWANLFGGGEPDPVQIQQPTAMSYEGFAQLPRDHMEAAGSLENAGYSGGGKLPTPARIQELSEYAASLRGEIAGIQGEIDNLVDGPMKATLTAPMQADMAALQAELDQTESDLALAKQEAVALTTSLATLSDTEAKPEISTESIDEALQKVRRLAAELSGLQGSVGGVPGPAEIDGARAGGGDVQRGGTYLVGEEGPELVTFGQKGFVHNARATMRAMRGATARLGAGGGGSIPRLSGLGSFMERGAEALQATALRATGNGGGASGGMTLAINSPLTGPITIASGQNPLDMIEQIGEALEIELARRMRGLYADGV